MAGFVHPGRLLSKALAGGLALTGLVACSPVAPRASGQDPNVDVSQAAMPTILKPYAKIENLLYCIRRTNRLKNVVFSVGPFADSTGKINSTAAGATGNFLPQGGSSSYITDALRQAGAQVVSTYFGQPKRAVHVDYAINGIFNSLDFGQSTNVDLQIAGVGPILLRGWAQLTLTIQLDDAATRINRQIAMIQRPVRYQQSGLSVGRTFGNTLVTGTAIHEDQQRLQLEALNGPIALGVADVLMKQFPKTASCTYAVGAQQLLK